MDILHKNDYTGMCLKNITIDKNIFEYEKMIINGTFKNVIFKNIHLWWSRFINCKFIDCEFIDCKFSLVSVILLIVKLAIYH